MDTSSLSLEHRSPSGVTDGDVEISISPQYTQSTAEQWRATLARIVPAVVVLKVTHCRAFDTEVASSSYATGFVVDRSLGLILTNRHVVTPCPIVAEAIFQNREEVPVFPLYYDPIHDFGFFRFDPAHLKFMQPQDIVLAPEAAQVGLEIRVVGNDSGEKISILSGTLARLDRDAPHYGSDSYNDFNTFYIQAASGTKGGSSGSPVIDILGRAVGLNAGGRHKAASAYYLPLHRIVRALHLLRGCAALPGDGVTWKSPHSVISRGDLQATFTFKGFDELRRLGLRAEMEAGVRRTQQQRHLGLRHTSGSEGAEAAAVARTRATSENDDVAVADVDATSLAVLEGQSVGMLVIDSVVPKGPSDGILQSGDVLVRVNGHVVTDFLSLESILDDHVDTHVSVEVERGGASVTAQVLVQDLTVVTPKRFVEFGGGVVHGLSYQQARNHLSSVGQVYVADAGYLLSKAEVHKHSIITSLAGHATSTLDEFVAVLLTLSHGDRVPIEYFTFEERFRRINVILDVNLAWYGMPQAWHRDDAAGLWHPTSLHLGRTKPARHATIDHNTVYSRVETTDHACVDRNGEGGAADASTAVAPQEDVSEEERVQADATCGGGANTTARLGNVDAARSDMTPGMHRHPISNGSHDTPGAAAAAADEEEESIMTAGDAAGTASGQPSFAGALRSSISEEGMTPVSSVATLPGTGDASSEDDNERIETKHHGHSHSKDNWREVLEERMRRALVSVDVDIPLVALADGVYSRSFAACGIIVYLSNDVGVVLVDRNTAVISPADIMLSFGAFPAEVPARVRFLHPTHNFSLLTFDPGELSEEARGLVLAASLSPYPELQRGDGVELVCLNKSMRLLHRTSIVTNPGSAVVLPVGDVPRFRAVHEEVIKLDHSFGVAYSGALTDRAGHVRALWGTFSEQGDKKNHEWPAGIGIYTIQPWIEAFVACLKIEPTVPETQEDALGDGYASVQAGRTRKATEAVLRAPGGRGLPVRVLDAELEPLLLSKAAQFGLPQEWIARLVKIDAERRQVLRVRSTVAASHAAHVLHHGDMVLAAAGKPLTCFGDVERITQTWGSVESTTVRRRAGGTRTTAPKDEALDNLPVSLVPVPLSVPGTKSGQQHIAMDLPPLPLTIFRNNQVLEVGVKLGCEDGLGTDRLVHWCGAQLQAPHRSVRELGFVPPDGLDGVYISRWQYGSPAHRYGLYALYWITHVNDVPVNDLDAFLSVVKNLGDRADVRVRLVHFESSKPKVMTLKQDLRWWPTWELRLQATTGVWERVEVAGEIAEQRT